MFFDDKPLNAQKARELTEKSIKEARELALRQLFLNIQKRAADCQTKYFVEGLNGLTKEQHSILESMGYKIDKQRNGFEISWEL